MLGRILARLLGRKVEGRRDPGYLELQKRRLRTVLFFLGIVAAVGCVLGHQYEVSVGERSGRLIKFSREGVLFKTWEGELRLSESAAQTWSFTVPDGRLAAELQSRMGEDLTLHYSKRLVGLFWVGDTPYLVDGAR